MMARKVMTLACVVLLLATGISAFRAQNSGKPKQKKADYPVLDLNAPGPADPEEKARRKKKGEKYNNADFPLNPALENHVQTEATHFTPGTPAFPFSESAAVIIGTVTGAHAHLSADRSYVYSEFDILVEEVIKDDPRSPISVGQTVAGERAGGKVLVRPGNVHEFRTTLDPLGVGSRYVVFLRRRGDDYSVFTAYRLEGGLVYAVDDYFKPASEGKSEEEFMRDLRQAATSGAEKPAPRWTTRRRR